MVALDRAVKQHDMLTAIVLRGEDGEVGRDEAVER